MRRELLLIGEMIDAATQAQALVAAQLDDQVKARFPNIPGAQPARLRNRVIHGYWSIDLEILHTTATNLLPAFVEQLQSALAVLEAEATPG